MCWVCLCMYGQLLVLVIQPCCSSSLSHVHVFGLYLCFMSEISKNNNNNKYSWVIASMVHAFLANIFTIWLQQRLSTTKVANDNSFPKGRSTSLHVCGLSQRLYEPPANIKMLTWKILSITYKLTHDSSLNCANGQATNATWSSSSSYSI